MRTSGSSSPARGSCAARVTVAPGSISSISFRSSRTGCGMRCPGKPQRVMNRMAGERIGGRGGNAPSAPPTGRAGGRQPVTHQRRLSPFVLAAVALVAVACDGGQRSRPIPENQADIPILDALTGEQEPQDLFEVEADNAEYWRMFTLDTYDGESWTSAAMDGSEGRVFQSDPGNAATAAWWSASRSPDPSPSLPDPRRPQRGHAPDGAIGGRDLWTDRGHHVGSRTRTGVHRRPARRGDDLHRSISDRGPDAGGARAGPSSARIDEMGLGLSRSRRTSIRRSERSPKSGRRVRRRIIGRFWRSSSASSRETSSTAPTSTRLSMAPPWWSS